MGRGARALAVALLLAVTGTTLLPTGVSGSPASQAPVSYLLPRSAFNITDHNLTFATNLISLAPEVDGSFDLSLVNELAGSAPLNASAAEAQVAIGPGPIPMSGDETYITPIFIIQEAESGLLRIEYIPFAMNDTNGFVVYEGIPVAAGTQAFLGHELDLRFAQTGPAIAPYQRTIPYGTVNGNVTVTFDGSTLVRAYPLAWASLQAFYAYGYRTDRFSGGAVFANVTAIGPGDQSSSMDSGAGSSIPAWVVAFLLGAAAGGIGVFVALRWRRANRADGKGKA